MDDDSVHITYKSKRFKLCKVEYCGNFTFGLGYCKHHYYKFKRYDNPLYEKDKAEIRFCQVEGCNNIHVAKGYCAKHYSKFKRQQAKMSE